MPGFDPTKDYYQILEIPSNAGVRDIEVAYKHLVNRYHPDKHQGNTLEDLAQEKLRQLNEAYAVLSDTTRRGQYDTARRSSGRRSHMPTGGNYCAPQRPQGISGPHIYRIIRILLMLIALPFLMRVIRTPQVAITVGIALALAWFGPRIIKKMRRKK